MSYPGAKTENGYQGRLRTIQNNTTTAKMTQGVFLK